MSYHKFNIKKDEDGMSWLRSDTQDLNDEIKQLTARTNNQQDQIVRLKAQIDILMRVIKER